MAHSHVMMRDPEVPAPPVYQGLEPQMMTVREIREKLEELFEWLQTADDSPSYDETVLQSVRETANSLLEERRLRHSDESAPRGG